ncbi:MAG: HRDC domain-containing protein, partial [Pararhodobacter sp.]
RDIALSVAPGEILALLGPNGAGKTTLFRTLLGLIPALAGQVRLMGRDLVRPDAERHGALRMTDEARPVLRGEQPITLRADTVERSSTRAEPRALVSDEDAPLLSALKAKRRALADAGGVPPYVIFTDRSLIEMAETRPQTLDGFARISGVGATKLERYGPAFLEIITGAETVLQHPARRKLAGTDAGEVFDRLTEAQNQLSRGEDGTAKYLSCTHTTIRAIAERRPRTLSELERIQGMGAAKVERFGEAFLGILADS